MFMVTLPIVARGWWYLGHWHRDDQERRVVGRPRRRLMRGPFPLIIIAVIVVPWVLRAVFDWPMGPLSRMN